MTGTIEWCQSEVSMQCFNYEVHPWQWRILNPLLSSLTVFETSLWLLLARDFLLLELSIVSAYPRMLLAPRMMVLWWVETSVQPSIPSVCKVVHEKALPSMSYSEVICWTKATSVRLSKAEEVRRPAICGAGRQLSQLSGCKDLRPRTCQCRSHSTDFKVETNELIFSQQTSQ